MTTSTLPAITARYTIADTITLASAMDLGTVLIAREIEWRNACLANQDMSDLARDFCERDLANLETSRVRLESRCY